MAYVKNWLHCVWGTKNRKPYFTDEIRSVVFNHITENAKIKGIYIKSLNGCEEHIHCLLSLDPDKSLSYAMQLIKGEASFWINRNKLTKLRFEWADEYYAVSVSESHIINVIKYINNQENHHKRKSWDEEQKELLKAFGFE